MKLKDLLEAKEILDKQPVPGENRYVIHMGVIFRVDQVPGYLYDEYTLIHYLDKETWLIVHPDHAPVTVRKGIVKPVDLSPLSDNSDVS